MADTKILNQRGEPMNRVTSLLPWPAREWFEDFLPEAMRRPMFAIEEFYEGDVMVVRAELPGIDPDRDVVIELMDGALVISAEKSESREHSSDHVHRSEFRYGSLTRSVPIPKGVDERSVSATYQDGVLQRVSYLDPPVRLDRLNQVVQPVLAHRPTSQTMLRLSTRFRPKALITLP